MGIITNIKNMVGSTSATVKTGRQLYRMAKKSESYKENRKTIFIESNIKKEDSHAFQSAQVDEQIERILDSKKYSINNILVVTSPYNLTPLAALFIFNTEEKCRVRVKSIEDDSYEFVSDENTRHRVPVFYLRAGKKNRIAVELLQGDTVRERKEVGFFPDHLPIMLKNMVTIRKKGKPSESPYILVYGGDTRYPYVFDETGEIRYFISDRPKAYGMFPLSKGRFLFLAKDVSAPSYANPHAVLGYEMDFLGRVFREYYVPAGIHHDGCEMVEGGNLLAASSSMTEWVEDAVVEIDRNTGEVVKQLNLADIISNHKYMDFFDWAHVNTVSYLPEENCVLLCMRNLHTVMKVDWDTHEIKWLFCDPEFWKDSVYEKYVLKPEGDIAYSYQAHASYLLPEKTKDGKRQLIIYDNHWHKRRPVTNFDGDKKSYVRIYEIDEEAGTVSLQQSYGSPKSKIRSNGVISGKRLFSMSGYLVKMIDGNQGMITEHNKKTGKIVNRYLTLNSFFRAWPVWADFKELSRPMKEVSLHVLGNGQKLEKVDENELAEAKSMAKFYIPTLHKSSDRVKRKEDVIKAYNEKDKTKVDKPDMSLFCMKQYDDILMINGKDHYVQKVYMKGQNGCYLCDFTDTEQLTPQLFEESIYFVAVPVKELPAGKYDVYVQYAGQLYDVHKHFTV